MLEPTRWPRPTAAFLNERLSRLEAACREANVPFHDDAGVDDHLSSVLLASDFAYQSLLRDPQLLGPDFLQLMSDPRHADARAGMFNDVHDANEMRRVLRRFRLREALRLIWRDVTGADAVETTLAGASVLAESCLEAALRGAERVVAERHGVIRDARGQAQRMVVLGLGKLGGGELNFSSDIDLVFAFAEHGDSDGARALDATAYYTRIGQTLVGLLADHSVDGYVYRVDLRLRPFGSAGRLALSFTAMEQYFQREGRDWERYAWIKARPVAGDRVGGARLLETLRPFVFRRYLDYTAFAGLREMKSLIDAEVARKDLADHLKLGPGGIREIEFIVQLVQLIRGGREPTLRARGLLPALAACEQLGFIPSARAQRLREAYRFLRRLENRVQMFADQQTHEIPADGELRERLALALGRTGWSALEAELRVHRTAVAEEFAALMAVDARNDAQQAQARWPEFWRALLADGVDAAAVAAAGFDPPTEATAELEALLGGAALRTMSARARERLDAVMPAVFAAAFVQEQPARCLARLLRLVQATLRRSVYLALLEEQPAALRRLSAVFAASAFLAERVIAHPLLLDDLFDDRVDGDAPDATAIRDELARRLGMIAEADPEAEIEAIQEQRQSALFRIGLAFLGGRLDARSTAAALADVAEAIVGAVLHVAERDMVAAHGRIDGAGAGGDGSGLIVVAYGSFGGRELGFGSDLDLVFLYDGARAPRESDGAKPLDGARYYARFAQRVVHLLGTLTRAGRLYEVDVRLRPDGSKGMLVQSLDGYAAYQRERAWTWELQALVRARAVAGDAALARRYADVRAELLAQPRDAAALHADVVSMRARWRAERDRSSAAEFDLKQGHGGLVDLEFLLQGLVLQHAARHPALLANGGNAALIDALRAARRLDDASADALARAHAGLLARAIRCTLDARPRVVARDDAIERDAASVAAACAGAGFDFT
ncbi:glutamate-ammonia-ligase adenylyltransferase [Dokdonella fugitiva]|uniref:Bifunctional glutamine synthetase adenylyltransferase/adenylyl-removing enzyme n=1 Tax=Dokdonella fugitiva TaxID=328517 RepID=A0A839EY33_9GAMM|nr:bifunctional [glutamate--ammonia ligase]-adenylyl-L-tyrosine phosphorylase/[glutamate--ammonia-ligase] adenylyltransferase [Dokdonella fugitiva]MBA8889627.1 glutamate-ammonia-ligase adenylyltransferase [Dokdonella fugitiva]